MLLPKIENEKINTIRGRQLTCENSTLFYFGGINSVEFGDDKFDYKIFTFEKNEVKINKIVEKIFKRFYEEIFNGDNEILKRLFLEK